MASRLIVATGEACQNRPVPADRQLPGQRGAPSISVLICAYTLDRLEALSRAIESVRAQETPAYELVLAIDHSPELLAECERRWPDARLVENGEEQGLSGARNSGVVACSGEVIAFLDDDAVAAPDWLTHLSKAYADPATLGAGGAVRPA